MCPTTYRRSVLAGLLAALTELAHSSETPALIDRPNADAGPTQISVEIWVVDINTIGARHEMLHELNRRDVFANLPVWLSGILERSS